EGSLVFCTAAPARRKSLPGIPKNVQSIGFLPTKARLECRFRSEKLPLEQPRFQWPIPFGSFRVCYELEAASPRLLVLPPLLNSSPFSFFNDNLVPLGPSIGPVSAAPVASPG